MTNMAASNTYPVSILACGIVREFGAAMAKKKWADSHVVVDNDAGDVDEDDPHDGCSMRVLQVFRFRGSDLPAYTLFTASPRPGGHF